MVNFKSKVNLVLIFIMILLVMAILFIDDSTLNSLYISYDDFVINEINIESRNDSVVYNEVDTTVSTNDNFASVVLVNNNISKWSWPTDLNYVITSGYGYRWGSMHDALDISGLGYGSNIYAANSGIVVSVKGGCVTGNLSCNGRGGNYIIIRHNLGNYHTIYMHLKDIRVSEGQLVSSGQVIGTMGNTGNVRPIPTVGSTLGTHLHFGLYVGEPYRGGYSINPMSVY